MLMPKRVKYRKMMRGRLKGKAQRGNQIAFGTYGLQSMESQYLTSRQIEAARRAIVRYVRRGGKIWIRVFPDKPVTMRAAETRMGSGKGCSRSLCCGCAAGTCSFRNRRRQRGCCSRGDAIGRPQAPHAHTVY